MSSLSPAALAFVEKLAAGHGGTPGLNVWLVALLERYGPMAESLVRALSAAEATVALRASVARGETGLPLPASELVNRASEHAAAQGKALGTERDLLAVVLESAGYEVIRPSGKPSAQPAAPGVRPEATVAPTSRPTPTLDRYGRDLTRAAREGQLGTVVGRNEELDAMILTLCRLTKPNPLLVGPAGTGKTAIVEALAARIAAGAVPPRLAGARIVSLQPSALVAGAGVVGELDKRMEAVVAEASQPGVILFIDEVHALIGAGGREGTGDMASMLKPALARGAIACIAATTDDEYRRFIESDKALERRFQPIRITEMTPAMALDVLRGIRPQYAEARGIQVSDDVLAWLVTTAERRMPNRRFPDKAVDLLDHVVAHALAAGLTTVDVEAATEVVDRLLGGSDAPADALSQLASELVDQCGLDSDAVQSIVERLGFTMRGLDLQASRPNLVVALAGDAAGAAAGVAQALAQHVFSDANRVVHIDFSRFVDEAGLRSLLGSPPSYVGYSDRHALDGVAENPWTVVLCERIDAAHPSVRGAFVPALTRGVLTDYRGRRMHFADTIVVLTAESVEADRPQVGFHSFEASTGRNSQDDDLATSLFGEAGGGSVDLVVRNLAHRNPATGAHAMVERTLNRLRGRLAEHRVELRWDAPVASWFAAKPGDGSVNLESVERLIEQELLPELVRHLPEVPLANWRVLEVRMDGSTPQVIVSHLPPDRGTSTA
ncbi:MAG: ATP-dependent Clp protease ATP-binding subunit [Gemmatimonadetes bacterium]|nr:ATP-dependent Clp protease ATP-binding subunit [Gemmatimonadota bacterium]